MEGDPLPVTYRDGNGKQRTAGTYGSRQQAEREYTKAKARVYDGIDVKPSKKPILLYADGTLDDYAPGWLAGHRLGLIRAPTTKASCTRS